MLRCVSFLRWLVELISSFPSVESTFHAFCAPPASTHSGRWYFREVLRTKQSPDPRNYWRMLLPLNRSWSTCRVSTLQSVCRLFVTHVGPTPYGWSVPSVHSQKTLQIHYVVIMSYAIVDLSVAGYVGFCGCKVSPLPISHMPPWIFKCILSPNIHLRIQSY